MPLVRSGRLLALAVTTRERVADAAGGADDRGGRAARIQLRRLVRTGRAGAHAAAGHQQAIAEVGRILRLPEVAERISASQGATAKPTTPEEFDQMVRNEIAIRSKVLKATGAKAE